jgi:transposase
MKSKDGFAQAYNAQAAVDAEAQIIVAHVVTRILLAANKRLNTAYVLREAFGQLWDYGREGSAQRFFGNWRASLKWQRLGPYERFADMIDRHWDGIAAYCKPENKVSLGFVEGLNNKIRVFQRRAYGLRDEEYLRLKVLTCMLPPL